MPIASRVIGVGKIFELDRIAPYWALINWGGMVSPKARIVPGAFQPGDRPPNSSYAGTRMGREQFQYRSSGGKFVMHVRNPIAPMHYIEKTVGWLRTVWIERLRSRVGKI